MNAVGTQTWQNKHRTGEGYRDGGTSGGVRRDDWSPAARSPEGGSYMARCSVRTAALSLRQKFLLNKKVYNRFKMFFHIISSPAIFTVKLQVVSPKMKCYITSWWNNGVFLNHWSHQNHFQKPANDTSITDTWYEATDILLRIKYWLIDQ